MNLILLDREFFRRTDLSKVIRIILPNLCLQCKHFHQEECSHHRRYFPHPIEPRNTMLLLNRWGRLVGLAIIILLQELIMNRFRAVNVRDFIIRNALANMAVVCILRSYGRSLLYEANYSGGCVKMHPNAFQTLPLPSKRPALPGWAGSPPRPLGTCQSH
jgi:hypothetical protein